jgi:hypothetical protein
VLRIVDEGQHAASWIEMADRGDRYYGVCFFDLDESGWIVRITDFWPTPTDVPAGATWSTVTDVSASPLWVSRIESPPVNCGFTPPAHIR